MIEQCVTRGRLDGLKSKPNFIIDKFRLDPFRQVSALLSEIVRPLRKLYCSLRAKFLPYVFQTVTEGEVQRVKN